MPIPEERGLYKKMEVGEQVLYLAQLKGLSKQEALKRLKYWKHFPSFKQQFNFINMQMLTLFAVIFLAAFINGNLLLQWHLSWFHPSWRP